MNRFNFPLRRVRQEQEWRECEQRENETFDEFVTRLRTIWSEQRPHETEQDLINHLLRKMRQDFLMMMGVLPEASLEEIMYKAQKIEEIICRRQKTNDEKNILDKRHTQIRTNLIMIIIKKSINQLYLHMQKLHKKNKNNYTQSNNYETKGNWRNNQPTQESNYNVQFTTNNSAEQNKYQMKCRRCGKIGHYEKHCRTTFNKNPNTLPSNQPKNELGALSNGRDSNARH